ncbi:hypothetical protein [Rhizobium sp. RU36D]|uniref:hypothetical protein n=1 Tax=Rhizobium sp. RU36D TaxID=1907415 RepID=UPI0009D8F4DE|nr:hypothetical protein [Rhizobium sp. RU36D]SMC39499.1 hypothetical protein SAMN05880593_10127 [Rhizobium sp. RU36D]
MMVGRRFIGHVSAILAGSLVILAGTEGLYFGPMGIVGGAMKWTGGLLIMLILALLTAPVGLLARYFSGMLPFAPLPVACILGAIIGLVLIPTIQPLGGTAPVNENLLAYSLIHLLAGTAGGFVWYRAEFRCRLLGTGV